MDDSNRQNNTPGLGDAPTGGRPVPPPPPPPQPSGGYSPPPPPPRPQPYPANPPTQAAQPYPQNTPQPPGYGGASSDYSPPTASYPVQGQVPPGRHDPPTAAYPQGVYGAGPGGPPQGYPPQDAYPPQYGAPVPPPPVVPPKKGMPAWAIAIPLLLVLAIGGALIAWSVLQSQENERKVAAASTATAQSQATATSAQAEINRKATGTVVAQKTATAATDAANKRGTSTAAAIVAKTSTAVAQQEIAAAQTATAAAQAAIAAAKTATALAIVLEPTKVPIATIAISPDLKGEIQNINVDYDVTEDGKKGMRIHVKFTVDNAKDVPCQATAYFYDEATGETVKNTDPNYSSVTGDLAVSSTFKPGFDSTIYDDFILFMPYEQIRLTGEHKLYFIIQAYVLSPYKIIVASARQPFTFTK